MFIFYEHEHNTEIESVFYDVHSNINKLQIRNKISEQCKLIKLGGGTRGSGRPEITTATKQTQFLPGRKIRQVFLAGDNFLIGPSQALRGGS